jgi:hypothetical protein
MPGNFKFAEHQHLTLQSHKASNPCLQGGTQGTVIAGHKSVNMETYGNSSRSLALAKLAGLESSKAREGPQHELEALENLFRSYWAHRGPATRAQGSSRVNMQDGDTVTCVLLRKRGNRINYFHP